VPANYNLDINTKSATSKRWTSAATAALVTQGGNIHTQRIGRNGLQNATPGRPVAKLVSEGGHIQIGDVVGDVSAFTAGGHIIAGYISGEAICIPVAATFVLRASAAVPNSLRRRKHLVGKAAKYVSVKTGGGQIDFGEVAGLRARPNGWWRHSRHVRRSPCNWNQTRQYLSDQSREFRPSSNRRRQHHRVDQSQ